MANPAEQNPPREKRSQETQRRLLASAEALIAAEGITGLSIAEVVRRARSSVGSFYSRFGDKDGLLRAIHARRLGDVFTALDEIAPAIVRLGRADAVALRMNQIEAHHVENAELVGAFIARSGLVREGWAASIKLHVQLVRRLAEVLQTTAGESAHPAPNQALQLGLHLAFSFLGDLSIHGGPETQFAPFSTADL
ncbi:MAG: AcrR family transcriptional regulator [Myxococcota bacterium]|jgi:AcrR family transcriptional regulator